MKTQELKELNDEELKAINGGSSDGMPPPPDGSDGSGEDGEPQPGYDGVGGDDVYGPYGPKPWHRIP